MIGPMYANHEINMVLIGPMYVNYEINMVLQFLQELVVYFKIGEPPQTTSMDLINLSISIKTVAKKQMPSVCRLIS